MLLSPEEFAASGGLDHQPLGPVPSLERQTSGMGASGVARPNAVSRALPPVLGNPLGGQTAVGDWIERVYNRRRRHSALKMLSPVRFEELHRQMAEAA